jgi:hypothetical protein
MIIRLVSRYGKEGVVWQRRAMRCGRVGVVKQVRFLRSSVVEGGSSVDAVSLEGREHDSTSFNRGPGKGCAASTILLGFKL